MYAIIIVIIANIFYPKTRVNEIVVSHIKTLYNAKKYKIDNTNKKIYWLDIAFFYIFPGLVSTYLVYFQDQISFNVEQINVLYLVFLPILFGSLAVVNNSINNSKNKVYTLYAKEVFYNISYGSILSLLGILINIIALLDSGEIISLLMIFVFISFLLVLVLSIKRMVTLLNPKLIDDK